MNQHWVVHSLDSTERGHEKHLLEARQEFRGSIPCVWINKSIPGQDSAPFQSTSEPLGLYPIQCPELELKHDDKKANEIAHDNDVYVSDG